MGVLLASRTAWLAPIVFALVCVGQLGRVYMHTRNEVNEASEKVHHTDEAYHELRKAHAAAGDDERTVEALDPGRVLRAAKPKGGEGKPQTGDGPRRAGSGQAGGAQRALALGACGSESLAARGQLGCGDELFDFSFAEVFAEEEGFFKDVDAEVGAVVFVSSGNTHFGQGAFVAGEGDALLCLQLLPGARILFGGHRNLDHELSIRYPGGGVFWALAWRLEWLA